MERRVAGFHQDPDGDWVAELDCGHAQHVRHRPPFEPRPWVLEASRRAERVGSPIECPACDRPDDRGGDPACWAGLVCAVCGAIGAHRAPCGEPAGPGGLRDGVAPR